MDVRVAYVDDLLLIVDGRDEWKLSGSELSIVSELCEYFGVSVSEDKTVTMLMKEGMAARRLCVRSSLCTQRV